MDLKNYATDTCSDQPARCADWSGLKALVNTYRHIHIHTRIYTLISHSCTHTKTKLSIKCNLVYPSEITYINMHNNALSACIKWYVCIAIYASVFFFLFETISERWL